MSEIILGIDPGYGRTGYGVISKNGNHMRLITYGCIETSSKDLFEHRLKQLYEETQAVILEFKPDYCCIEDLFFHSNAKTALKVGQARGVLMLTAIQANLPIYEFTPLQVKQAITGYGRADKKQMQQMMKILLNLKEIPKPDDAADALAIAWCGATSRKMKDLSINNVGRRV